MTNKEIAERILKALQINEEYGQELEMSFQSAFYGDPIHRVYFLASHWYNDLIEWCKEQLEEK